MEFQDSLPLMIYDNRCYVCIKFAKLMNFLAKGRLRMIGHYTEFGRNIRDEILGYDALEMFWYIDKETAYGGRAAIIPLLSTILRVRGRKFNQIAIQESCDIGCKDSLAVFFRSASLITHSKKIKISNL
jgi:predicted DCC family thiol-disulfide oxidoreductase YuxK